MGTIAEKLTYLDGTKTSIKEAIEEKGVTVPSSATFREYAGLIRQISGNGSGSGSGGGSGDNGEYKLQTKEITPTGEDFTVVPDDGFDGFSAVYIKGDPNLVPRNIAYGIEIYGVTGELEQIAPTSIPEEYQSYVDMALQMYGDDDYTGFFLGEYSNWITVVLMFDNFQVMSYDSATSEYTATGAYFVGYNKSTHSWSSTDRRDSTSEGGNFIKNIRFSTEYLYYNGQIIYPYQSGVIDNTSTYTVTFMNGDTVLEVVNNVPAGGQAAYSGVTPSKEGYYFTGWSPSPTNIVANTVCYAQFSNSVDPYEIQDDWDTIVANGGVNYNIGAYKTLVLGTIDGFNYGTIRMQKVATNENGANSVWVAMEAFATGHRMNASNTNQGGWRDSEMRSWLNQTVLGVLPASLQSGIKAMTKYSYDYQAATRNVATTDKLWIPSRQEVFGESDTYETMGQYYSLIFKDASSRVRRYGYNGSTGYWWLRSAYSGATDGFRVVRSNGDERWDIASGTGGVVLGFGL